MTFVGLDVSLSARGISVSITSAFSVCGCQPFERAMRYAAMAAVVLPMQVSSAWRAVVELSLAVGATGLVEPRTNQNNVNTFSRRGVFASFGGIAAFSLCKTELVARAFDNKISTKYDDRPKQRGGKPNDLGVLSRKDAAGEDYIGLKHCKPNGAPNCFCSTESTDDDPEHSIPSWIWHESLGNDKSSAFHQLEEVLNAYKPGQSGIDGGGFKIITNDPQKGYIYIDGGQGKVQKDHNFGGGKRLRAIGLFVRKENLTLDCMTSCSSTVGPMPPCVDYTKSRTHQPPETPLLIRTIAGTFLHKKHTY
eukprot:scaffold10429_cov126-Cylindrotheca_fusiformis.AAC.6